MREKIPAGIIIFASLSSIIIAAIIAAYIYNMSDFFFPYLLFFVFWIITTTFLIRLKNWARIAYIIIHYFLVLFIVGICMLAIAITGFFNTESSSGLPDIGASVFISLIFLLPFFYSIKAIIYFSRSDTVKLFKQ